MKNITKLFIGLAVLGVLAPIGLVATGDAWGEWGKEAFESMIGFVPAGLARFADFWSAPFADYTVPGANDFAGYIISAFGGMLLVIIFTWAIGKMLARGDRNNGQ